MVTHLLTTKSLPVVLISVFQVLLTRIQVALTIPVAVTFLLRVNIIYIYIYTSISPSSRCSDTDDDEIGTQLAARLGGSRGHGPGRDRGFAPGVLGLGGTSVAPWPSFLSRVTFWPRTHGQTDRQTLFLFTCFDVYGVTQTNS